MRPARSHSRIKSAQRYRHKTRWKSRRRLLLRHLRSTPSIRVHRDLIIDPHDSKRAAAIVTLPTNAAPVMAACSTDSALVRAHWQRTEASSVMAIAEVAVAAVP